MDLFGNYFFALVWAVSGVLLTIIYWSERGQAFISPIELVDLINKHGANVLDFRPLDQFQQQYLPMSRHVLLDQLHADNSTFPNKKKPLVIVGATMADTRRAFYFFHRAKYEQVVVLSGGIQAWVDAGFLIKKGKAL